MALPLLGAGLAVDVLPFTPASISGLQLWLDASDSGTLFQNSNGTTAATADGDPVGYWGDKSGNGRHAKQNDGARKTSLKIDSRRSVQFNGTNAYLYLLNMPLTKTSVFAVVDSPYDYTQQIIIQWGGSNSDNQIHFWIRSSRYACYFGNANGTSNELVQSTNKNSSPIVMSSIYDTTGKLTINNTLNDSKTFQGTMPSGTSYMGLGVKLDSAGNTSAPSYFGGKMYEILIYENSVSDTNVATITNYLNTKWSIY